MFTVTNTNTVVEKNRERFIKLFRNNVHRHGSEEFLDWLDNATDFFVAPASTRYHDAVDGGLCKHSLEVYDYLIQHGICEAELESKTIVALLHDICKTDLYKKSFRNVKNEAGQWVKEPCYIKEDKRGLGHGSCSVFLIQRFMQLTLPEMQAIYNHMSGWSEDQASVGVGFQDNSLALELAVADLRSTYLKNI